MTTKISPDQAMDALIAARPDIDDLGHDWYPGRRARVLRDVLAQPRTGSAPRPRPVRRWGLIAAAAAVVSVLGLLAQVLVPLGSPGSPQTAQALENLALAVPGKPVIPESSYQLTVYNEAGLFETEDGMVPYTTERHTWLAADGWAWAHQTGDDPAYYIFQPAPRNYDLNLAPADPALMQAYLRARVMGSSSVEEAIFEAVKETLIFTPTPAATRAAAIRMLKDVPGVSVVEDSTDPAGRSATEVRFVDDKNRPGMENSIFLDSADTQLLAERHTSDGKPYYTCIYTERRIVSALPDEIVKVLGNERVVTTID